MPKSLQPGGTPGSSRSRGLFCIAVPAWLRSSRLGHFTRMSTDMSSAERARRIVGYHKKGVICAGEVWNQFIDQTTPETFADFMAELTPELRSYFRQVVFVHHDPAACRLDSEREALRRLSAYYETHAA